MTGFFAAQLQPSWLILGLWMFLPYVMLFLLIRAARTVPARVVVLVTALSVICYDFSVYFDRAFVSFSSIDFSAIEVPFGQSVIVAASWIIARRRDSAR